MTPKNMSMTDDIKALVERLRKLAQRQAHHPVLHKGRVLTEQASIDWIAADALTRLSAENERLREALLARVQAENECPGSNRRTFPYEQCTGWNAEKCGCALEARALASGEPAHKSGQEHA